MASQIISLLLEVFKLVSFIVTTVKNFNAEEQKRYDARIAGLTNLLKEMSADKTEIINENDYLSNMDWEKKTRYEAYKASCLAILTLGGGIDKLLLETKMGMSTRIDSKKDAVLQILAKPIEILAKSQLIAKLLSE